LRNRPFWGVVEKSNFLICQKSTTAVTLLLTTWQQQQHHQTANYIMYTEKPATGLRHTPFPPLPAKLMKTQQPLLLVAWNWPKLGVFCIVG
jgi:hypothetical protein